MPMDVEAFEAVTADIVEAKGHEITKDNPIYRVVCILTHACSRANSAFLGTTRAV